MRLVSVFRRPQLMVALISEHVGTRGTDDPYRETAVPLARVPEALCSWKDKDVAAWRALAKVPNLGRRAGATIIRALIGSVTDPATVLAELPPLRFDQGAVDVRPYLCDWRHEQAIIDGLGAVVTEVSTAASFPTWHWSHREAIVGLPSGFRAGFLWGLHLSPWSLVELTLAIYQALELDDRPALRRAVARLLSKSERAVGVEWARALADLPREQHVLACEAIVEGGAFVAAPTPDDLLALGAGEFDALDLTD